MEAGIADGDSMVPEAAPAAAGDLLTPANHMLAMVDLQSQMDFATTSIDPVRLRNNAAMVAMTGGQLRGVGYHRCLRRRMGRGA